jgi:hypothetical protein
MNSAKDMIKQMIDLNKGSVLSMCQAISLLQEQTESLTSSMLDQATWVPESGRNMISEWSKAGKKNLESFKKNIEMGYDKIEDMIR